MSVAASFIRGGAGHILVVSHEAERPTGRAVLVVPAFAEEMNKSRRLIWELGMALARYGVRLIAPDLYGTGDSEGEFADARWEIWIDDLDCTVRWAQEGGADKMDVLLVRLGAALFADAVPALGNAVDRAVAWHPISRGADVLAQLLRMKSMALRMAGGRAAPLEELRRSLLNGTEPTELGGYHIAPALAQRLQRAVFVPSAIGNVRAALSIELDPAAPSDSLRPVAELPIPWTSEVLAAERFWLATEPRANPSLIDATLRFLVAA